MGWTSLRVSRSNRRSRACSWTWSATPREESRVAAAAQRAVAGAAQPRRVDLRNPAATAADDCHADDAARQLAYSSGPEPSAEWRDGAAARRLPPARPRADAFS